MAKQSASPSAGGLDQLLEKELAHPRTQLPRAPAKLRPLLRVAAELRGLPRREFRARLQADLERRATMASQTPQKRREGFQSLTPYLVVERAAELVEFVKQAFGAVETFRQATPGGLHAEVRIRDSMLKMGGFAGMPFPAMPAALHLYVDNVDEVYRRALAAGATSLMPPTDQEYGDRDCALKDPFGDEWHVATHRASEPLPEGMRSLTPYLHPKGAAELIDFLRRALGAEEIGRQLAPEGTVAHAKLRLGDSILELGEAHGVFQPMPCMLYLYVDDADALYRRAVRAGAVSIQEPADQPYGDRNAAVRDPAGNHWYVATPLVR